MIPLAMRNKEREKNNELIAHFMGLHYDSARRKLWQPIINVTPTDFHNFICGQMTDETWYVDELKFHESFDWLMPVVDKIETLNFDVQVGSGCLCRIWDIEGGRLEEIELSYPTKLESTYQAVVEFIKWYNETKLSKNERKD
jgi:hypothetical protein